MDFEVLSGRPKPASFFELFERLLSNRRVNWPRWTQRPPHALGWFVFFIVTFEMTLSARLVRGEGLDVSIWRSVAATGGLLLVLETLLAVVTAQAAELFETEGQIQTLITFFNLSLTPLLLVLPLSVIVDISGSAHQVRFLLMFFLGLKVLLNWREAVELTYKLKKMQSAMVLYISSAILFLVLLLSVYAALIHRVSSFFH